MAVSSWGGVTIYTATVPSGTPADRVGEGAKLTPTPPSIQDMRKLASAWAQRLQHDLALATHFDADWETQLLSGDERRFVADAMLNIERAFARIKNSAASRGAAAKIDVVRIEQAKKANVVSRGGTLTVTVAPGPSLSSRPSSLAIARALTQSR